MMNQEQNWSLRRDLDPATITLPKAIGEKELESFRIWLNSKYSVSYARKSFLFANKYSHLLGTSSNLSELERLPVEAKNSAVKALVLLAKFQGRHKQFKQHLSDYDIKLEGGDSFKAFLRIFNAKDSDILNWYRSVMPHLRGSERLFTRYLLWSGLRTSEGIESFNKIIDLTQKGKLGDYYNDELTCLCHFKFPDQFIRRTKNCFLTFITPEFLKEISQSEEVNYNEIRKRLQRRKVAMRYNELRDFFGTFLLQNGVLEQEVNLLQDGCLRACLSATIGVLSLRNLQIRR